MKLFRRIFLILMMFFMIGAFIAPTMLSSVTSSAYAADDDAGDDAGMDWLALDQYFINFAKNISAPLVNLIGIVAWLIGLTMEVCAVLRVTKPGFTHKGTASGTVMMLIVGALLMSLPAAINVMENSIFNADQVGMTQEWEGSDLSYLDSDDTDRNERILRAINASFQYIRILGLIAFIRGLYLLKTAVDGGQASMLTSMLHIFGGVLAMNIGPVIRIFNASVQS